MTIREAQVVRGESLPVVVPRQGGAPGVTSNEPTAAAAPPRAERPVRVLTQIPIIMAAVAVYFLVRGATHSEATEAVANAHRVIGWEKWLGIYHEPALQRDLAHNEAVRTVFNWVYIWGHWPVIVVVFLLLARYNAGVYRRLRNAMMLSGAIGFAFFALFPVAPPRLAGLGMADTVTLTSQSYRVLQPTIFTNQFAAMPSLHAGWNLLIGLSILAAARRPLMKAVGVVLPMAMIATVVLTANHYILDVVVGVSLTTTCWFLVALPWGRFVERLRAARPRGRVLPSIRQRTPEGNPARGLQV